MSDNITSYFTYKGSRKREISFPLGGIGSGCIGLSGNGRLYEWEIMNRPNKEGINGFSHFAIKAETNGHLIDAKVLNGDYEQTYTGKGKIPYDGIGFGVDPSTMGGMPHFEDVEFRGEYPIASLTFKDSSFPGVVNMKAFNPFIPLNPNDSSIPAAFFEIEIENTTEKQIDYTLCLSIKNPLPPLGAVNSFLNEGGLNFIKMTTVDLKKNHVLYGDVTFATDAPKVSYQENWFESQDWFDSLTAFWKEFSSPGMLKNHKLNPPKGNLIKKLLFARKPGSIHASLAAHVNLKPNKKTSIRFIITWNFPNCYNYHKLTKKAMLKLFTGTSVTLITPDKVNMPDMGDFLTKRSKLKTWKNFYTKLFKDSVNSAKYGLKNWDRLYLDTNKFKKALFSSSLPLEVIDAVSANISTLKTPTTLRLEDGTFWGWEGCSPNEGCCEGSCTHVWNYAYALPFLFPSLERSMREADYKYNLNKDGLMEFRLSLPIGSKNIWSKFMGSGKACADGQFGGVIKTYRDWKISGDSDFLRRNWESVKSSLEFAWSESNKHMWDRNKEGVLKGRQHHTLDTELFGPNSWLTGFYLGALKSASEMASYLGENEKSDEYFKLFQRGKEWVDNNLFNGEYYFHEINLSDKELLKPFEKVDSSVFSYYWNDEVGEIKYQLGEGCIADQVVAQWHANMCGLGDIFDNEQTKIALNSLFKYNFKMNLRQHFNPCRVYALDGESGLAIAQWPEGKRRPFIPAPYSEEMWPGFEYHVACHLIQEGFIEKGLKIVQAARSRYDGSRRNPWSEIECGSNYARSMSSYSLISAFCGFEYDLVEGMIGFHPVVEADEFICFWSLGTGWGTIDMNSEQIKLIVLYGELKLKKIRLSLGESPPNSIGVGKREIKFSVKNEEIIFEKIVIIDENNPLVVKLA
ncbi:MAG: hypothetical protein GY870_01465 [archaeon]|nr:hypothetical protein [archaeon]